MIINVGKGNLKEVRREFRGFSLIEVMLALAILSALLVSVVALFTGLSRSATKSADLAAGQIVAESVMTETLYNIFETDLPIAKADLFDPSRESPPDPPLSGVRVHNGTTFSYEITYATIQDEITSAPLGAGLTNNSAKKIDIVVWWKTPDADQMRDGVGFQRTTQTRIVNQGGGY